jgi:peptidoglycan/xylan/chitin deacetylase (PgdA/CDA1 family)
MLKLLKRSAKAMISPVMDATGLYERRIERASRREGSWTIVMYHRVIDDPDSDPFQLGMCVMRQHFEAQVRLMLKHFQLLSVGEACARLRRGESLPPAALSITFDDGYLDNLTLALPVLQRLGAPFTVYVPTGGLSTGQPHWWDCAIAALATTQRAEVDLQELGLSTTSDVVRLQGVMAAPTAELILERLWALDFKTCQNRLERLQQCVGASRHAPALAAPLLSAEQVRELRRQGAEIGAHSVTHQNLALADDAVVRHEMTESRRVLEELLQEPVTGFAHPGGHEHVQAEALATAAGFEHVLSTRPGVNHPAYQTMALRRIGMPDSDLADFRRAFSGAMLTAAPTHIQF